MIDFNDVEDLAEFVSVLRINEMVPDDVAVYEADALDFIKDSGVTKKYTYLLRRDPQDGRKRLVVNRSVEV